MKQVKVGMFVQVIRDVDMKNELPNVPVTKYQHLKVTTVTDQDNIRVKVGASTLFAQRLSDPMWRNNRFGVGG